MADPKPFLEVTWQDRDITASVRSVEIEDNDRLIDEARITLQDPHGTGGAVAAPGQKIKVDLGWDGEHAVLFEGVVVAPSNVAAPGGSQSVTIVARDLAQTMNVQPRDQEFRAGKLSALIRSIVSRYPIPIAPNGLSVDPDPEFSAEGPPLVQLQRKDFEYLQELAARYGARAFVEYNDGRSQFYFKSNKSLLQADPLGKLQYCRGLSQLIEFSYERVAARAAVQTTVTTVDPVAGTSVSATGAAPAVLPGPTVNPDMAASAGRVDPAVRSGLESGIEAAQTPAATPATGRRAGLPSDANAPDTITITDPTRVLGLRGKGRAVGTVMLRAKGKVTIEGIAPWAEGDWYVEKAIHTWRDTSVGERRGSSYETRFTATR
jgi:phage protein D